MTASAFEVLDTASDDAFRSLQVMVNLGVPDIVADDVPKAASAIAKVVGAHPEALDRVLKLLVLLGVFEARDGGYVHSELSRLLRADHPQSLRPFIRRTGLPIVSKAFRRLDDCLRTGRTAFDTVGPGALDRSLREHPDDAAMLDELAAANCTAVVSAYDFSPFQRIADLAGDGRLLRSILDKHPAARGVLFGATPTPGGGAKERERTEVVPGNVLTDPLPKCDGYVLMDVLQKFPDADATTILNAIRRAGMEGARVLIVEALLPPPDERRPRWAAMLDVENMILTGGRVRTAADYEALLGKTGFRLQRVIPAGTFVSIVEALAV